MPEQQSLFWLQIAPMPSHTVWQTPVLGLHKDVALQHTDVELHAEKSGTHAPASFAASVADASCGVPLSFLGIGL